ncbi:uncharacterized protein [Henckelia pumila]|uniref:uncharacterized protein n=1 Tax=Henckelia pumila TaxID=405737 RepID=UPI003C6DF698
MASENFVQPAIPRFDGHYDHWSMLMENFLRSKEYWTVVVSGVAEPAAGIVLTDAQKTELEGLKLKDLKAKNYLFQSIDRSILETILCKDTANHIWDSMKKKYQGAARAKRQQLQALRLEFEMLQMKSGESVTDYFERTMAIVNKMRILGDKTDDVLIVEKVLRSMTPKFNFVVCTIEEANDVSSFSIDELQSSLLVHEQKINQQEKKEQALKFISQSHSTHGRIDRGRGRGRGQSRGEKEEEESLLMVCHEKEETPQNMWYLDTGCSNHMCGDKQAFSDLDESFRSSVKFGDNSTIFVMGKGKANRMFPLYLHNTVHSCLYAKLKDEAWLWHFRYGHLNFGGLRTLQQKNMVMGLPQLVPSSQVCEDFVVSKQHRNQFPQGKSMRAKEVLEIVHSDICGPINPESNGGKRYLITFIDDFSRKTWVYFLQEKSEAFVAFKNYKVLVEKEVGRTIKVLRTDRGGEYNSNEFSNFCETHGIKRQLTAAYTPQQNGVCERKNRTIMNMVRSLLRTSGVPKNFWPEAVNWTVHILNRSPTLSVQNMTPEEAWSGRKPVVDHFRIFGCIAYAHVLDVKRTKLDDKGEKYIFLGVSYKTKAYKLYNPNTKKIVISRDVVFDEKTSWSWAQNDVKENIPADFDDDEQEQQPMEGEQEEEAIPNDHISPVLAQSQRPHRVRRRP